jgi:hypothetical protein
MYVALGIAGAGAIGIFFAINAVSDALARGRDRRG